MPSVVKPTTFLEVAEAKYDAAGSSKFTIPKEGTFVSFPAISFV